MSMVECVSVENMRTSDRQTIEGGISGRELIFRAANAVFQAVDWHGKIAVVTGSGNNGADGYALANILHANGFQTTVFSVSSRLHDDCAFYALAARNNGVPVELYQAQCKMLDGYDVIVDCMLGTGFNGQLRTIYREAISEINQTHSYVVSVDINSGLNGDTGEGDCVVHSNLTVTVEFIKKGMVSERAGKFIGKLVCVKIGIILAEIEAYISDDQEWHNLCNELNCSEDNYRVLKNGVYYYKRPLWVFL